MSKPTIPKPDHECPKYENQICCLRFERDRLRREIRDLRQDICENAHDVYWCGPGETVCERITAILDDGWEQGNV